MTEQDPDRLTAQDDEARVALWQALGFRVVGWPDAATRAEDERVMQRLRWHGFENWEQG